MLQLGNLAIVCAKRSDILLQIISGRATVFAGIGPERKHFVMDWKDDDAIESLIHELNFGSLREEALYDSKH